MNRASTALLAMLAGIAPAAEHPNFSGEWKMNAEKSDFGKLPPTTSFARKIVHVDPSLTIATSQGDIDLTVVFDRQ
jgi:hypothetical protein